MLLQSIINSGLIYYILAIGIMVWSLIVRARLNRLIKKYSEETVMSLKDSNTCVREMLQANEIYNVEIQHTRGDLTDNYNPKEDTINLSDTTYGMNSITAVAVAAHECGHAVQHKVGYSMLQLRTKMVPIVSFASNTIQWLLLAGIVVAQWTPIPLYIAIALFATTVLFSFVTLPVEVDASRRAVNWLEGSGIVSGQQLEYAKDALRAAAYTYVVAAIGSLATLLYYIAMIFGGRRS